MFCVADDKIYKDSYALPVALLGECVCVCTGGYMGLGKDSEGAREGTAVHVTLSPHAPSDLVCTCRLVSCYY